MKLTPNQIKVLSHLEFSAQSSVADIARSTGLRPSTVRHTQDWLLKNGCYQPYVCLNNPALGLIDYGINIRHGMSANERAKFLSYLKRSPQVPWVVEMEGAFQFSFAFLAKSPLELDRFLVSISELSGMAVKEHTIAPRLRWDLYSHCFEGSASRGARHGLSWGDPPTDVKVDDEEVAVLKLICLNPQTSVSKLAKANGIPVSTFQYRLNSLIKKRVILGFVAYYNFTQIGYRKYRLLIFEKRMESKSRAAFEKFCRLHPLITTCLRVLSEWTYEVDVNIVNNTQLVDLRQAIQERFSDNITRIDSMEYIKVYKMGMDEDLNFYQFA